MAESELGPEGLVKDSAVNPGSLFNFDASPGSKFGKKIPKVSSSTAAQKAAANKHINKMGNAFDPKQVGNTSPYSGVFATSDVDEMARVNLATAAYRPSAEMQAANEEAWRADALQERGRLEGIANQDAFNALTTQQKINIEQAIADPNSPLFRPLKFDEEGQVIPRTPDDAANAYGFLRRLGTTAGDIGQTKGLDLSSIFMPGGANAGSVGIGTGMVINDEGKSVPGQGSNIGFNQSDSTNEGLNALPNSQTNPLLATFMATSIFTDASAQAQKDMLLQLAPIFEMLQPTVSTVGQPGPQTVAVRGGF
jgi:hypothetical protein